jgi:hypothetical protein
MMIKAVLGILNFTYINRNPEEVSGFLFTFKLIYLFADYWAGCKKI